MKLQLCVTGWTEREEHVCLLLSNTQDDKTFLYLCLPVGSCIYWTPTMAVFSEQYHQFYTRHSTRIVTEQTAFKHTCFLRQMYNTGSILTITDLQRGITVTLVSGKSSCSLVLSKHVFFVHWKQNNTLIISFSIFGVLASAVQR